jgi:hypothetical protein
VEHILALAVSCDAEVNQDWGVGDFTYELVLLKEVIEVVALVVGHHLAVVDVGDACSVVVVVPSILELFPGEKRVRLIYDCDTHN